MLDITSKEDSQRNPTYEVDFEQLKALLVGIEVIKLTIGFNSTKSGDTIQHYRRSCVQRFN